MAMNGTLARLNAASLAVAAVVVACVVGATARGEDPAPRDAKLRALADAYCADKDLDHARRSLDAIGATASDLLAVLREPAKPAQEMVGGTRTIEIEDEHGK